MGKIQIKTAKEVEIMRQGGAKLARIRKLLEESIKEGVCAWDIEELANKLITKAGGQASFKMVPKYSWATCINVDQGVVHGIPKREIIFRKGQLVSVDVGFFYKGFHTDTSTTVIVGNNKGLEKFLKTGSKALGNAIEKAVVGNRVYDISKAIEDTLKEPGYSPIRALTGHGVGQELHEAPYIPCFVSGSGSNSPLLEEGMVLAIEVMYAQGSPDLVLENDGWTIATQDGTISALFEETVSVTNRGPVVLTKI